MSQPIRRRKCKNCKDLFHPDPRNTSRQKFCSKPECRKASKKESQRRWLQKPENRDYFRGPDNVRRVQEWRKDHPGYWRKSDGNKNALQDPSSGKEKEKQPVKSELTKLALQDVLLDQPTVLIGLISHLTGYALQEDIARTARRMQQLGDDILHHPIHHKGGSHGKKDSYLSPAASKDTQTIQLGGSPSCP